MMYKAMDEIVNILKENKLAYKIWEKDKDSRILVNVNDRILNYQIQFILTDDSNDVAIRALQVKFPKEKQKAMILFANQCNSKYRALKFVVRCDDNTMEIEYDCTHNCNPGSEAFEILVHILKTGHAIDTDLMKQVWA